MLKPKRDNMLTLLAIVNISLLSGTVYSESGSKATKNFKAEGACIEMLQMTQADLENIKREISDINTQSLNSGNRNDCNGTNEIPRDCQDILLAQPEATSGIYVINMASDEDPRVQAVYCDMDTDGGGWTVFHRRLDGTFNFDRDYKTYAEGFGLEFYEFWMGNENLYQMTSRRNYQMRVDLESYGGDTAFAEYSSFRISSACEGFRLHINDYRGTAGDSLSYHDNQKFSTYDRDRSNPGNCAVVHKGAWWYKDCCQSNLNGPYRPEGTISPATNLWNTWLGYSAIKASEMKIRPTRINCPA